MSDKERDELAEIIANAEYPNMEPPWCERKDRSPVKWYSRKYADKILAAGYRKPRTITTIQELATLKSDAVVRDSDCRVLELMWDDGGPYWSGMGDGDFFNPPTLPATVLYEPTA